MTALRQLPFASHTILLAVTLCSVSVGAYAMIRHAGPLRSVPRGIVALELAGTRAAAQHIIAIWITPHQLDRAREHVWFDFLFVYACVSAYVLLLPGSCASCPGRALFTLTPLAFIRT